MGRESLRRVAVWGGSAGLLGLAMLGGHVCGVIAAEAANDHVHLLRGEPVVVRNLAVLLVFVVGLFALGGVLGRVLGLGRGRMAVCALAAGATFVAATVRHSYVVAYRFGTSETMVYVIAGGLGLVLCVGLTGFLAACRRRQGASEPPPEPEASGADVADGAEQEPAAGDAESESGDGAVEEPD